MSDDKPARIDLEAHELAGEMAKWFTENGLPQITRQKVMTAALRWMRYAMKQYQLKGFDAARIWRDIVNAGQHSKGY